MSGTHTQQQEVGPTPVNRRPRLGATVSGSQISRSGCTGAGRSRHHARRSRRVGGHTAQKQDGKDVQRAVRKAQPVEGSPAHRVRTSGRLATSREPQNVLDHVFDQKTGAPVTERGHVRPTGTAAWSSGRSKGVILGSAPVDQRPTAVYSCRWGRRRPAAGRPQEGGGRGRWRRAGGRRGLLRDLAGGGGSGASSRGSRGRGGEKSLDLDTERAPADDLKKSKKVRSERQAGGTPRGPIRAVVGSVWRQGARDRGRVHRAAETQYQVVRVSPHGTQSRKKGRNRRQVVFFGGGEGGGGGVGGRVCASGGVGGEERAGGVGGEWG